MAEFHEITLPVSWPWRSIATGKNYGSNTWDYVWLAGTNPSAGAGEESVLWTRDAGETWHRASTMADSTWHCIYPTGKGEVYIAGTARIGRPMLPIIMRSIDYGATWEERYSDGLNGDHYNSIAITFWAEGLAVGQLGDAGPIASWSPNGGRTWQPLSLPVAPGEGFYDVVDLWDHTGNRNIQWIVGGQGTVLRRERMGPASEYTDWVQISIPGLERTLLAIDVSRNGESIWITASDGRVAYSRNSGEEWNISRVGSSTLLYDIKFQDDRVGWVCGANGVLYETNDGGETWIRCRHPFSGVNWRSLAIVPGQKVYVVGTQDLSQGAVAVASI